MEGKLVLTTVGTSAFDPSRLRKLMLAGFYEELRWDLKSLPASKLYDWVNGNNNFTFPKAEAFIARYVDRALQYNIKSEVERPANGTGINVFSAELSSLHLLYENEVTDLKLDSEQDIHVLLLSQSSEGVMAGILTQRLMAHPEGGFFKKTQNTDENHALDSQLAIVSGLQVNNFRQFFSEGLRAYVSCIRNAAKSHPTKQPLLNITGGFKALVAYSAYFALALQIPMVFLFEEMANVIKLLPAPVALTSDQQQQLLGEIRQIVAISTGLEPDDFDLVP